MNCQLRAWTVRDAEGLAKIINNPDIQKNLRDGIPFPYTAEDARDYIRNALQAPVDSQYTWAIVVDGEIAGSIGVFRKDNIHYRTAEMGYFLAQNYWGRGVMTRAVRQACGIVFEKTDIVRIFAEPFALNTASCRVLEKAGFTYEGTLRKNAEKNGEIIDMKLYALLKDLD